MNGCYLVKNSEEHFHIGLIYEDTNEQKIDYDTKSIITFNNLKFQTVELSQQELTFYASIPKSQRVQSYERQIFHKINELKINDRCKIQIDCKIIDKIIENDHLSIKYETNDGQINDIRSSLIDDVWAVGNDENKEKEKLYFIQDKIVNSQKIFSAKSLNDHYGDGRNIGNSVRMNIGNKDFFGELKWIGLINNEKCVGVDMEDEFEYGMDGGIIDGINFDCLPSHGLITLLSNVELYKCDQKVEALANGIINPNKYLKCEEKWDTDFLEMKTITKKDLVYVRLNKSNGKSKIKGILQWCGLMNGVSVGGVELNEDHESGTDGRFWRQKLFDCSNKRAVAVLLDKIDKYTPYESKVIPNENRVFMNLDINSDVKYFMSEGQNIVDLYGTIKWIGVDENDEYLYGIELNEKTNVGTDGTFTGQRLFECENSHGILAPMLRICPDCRKTEIAVDPNDVIRSELSTYSQYGVLVKLSQGLHQGIQGNANSSYLDSLIFALFANCDVLDFMISPCINETETDEITKKLRCIISWKIIYPLREYGFVSFHRTEEMYDVINQYDSEFSEMKKRQTNMETGTLLLSKLCPTEQLLKILPENQSKTNSMFLELFLNLDHKSKYITSEEIIKFSMIQNGLVFAENPTCLIAIIPQNTKEITSFEYVLPNNIIEISHVCSNHWKKCYYCEEKAIYQCSSCIEENQLYIGYGFCCEEHACHHKKVKLDTVTVQSGSKVYLELKAVICIEECRVVSFVKQTILKDDRNKKNEMFDRKEFVNQWFCFDNMSSLTPLNQYPIPKVTQSRDISNFMTLKREDMEMEIESFCTAELKWMIKNSYIFIYHNLTKTCY